MICDHTGNLSDIGNGLPREVWPPVEIPTVLGQALHKRVKCSDAPAG
jgi:hypothetical protein